MVFYHTTILPYELTPKRNYTKNKLLQFPYNLESGNDMLLKFVAQIQPNRFSATNACRKSRLCLSKEATNTEQQMSRFSEAHRGIA